MDAASLTSRSKVLQRLSDPRDRVLGCIDFRKQRLRGNAPDFTCLLGILVQETFETHPRRLQGRN
jgi:hypothetical protein